MSVSRPPLGAEQRVDERPGTIDAIPVRRPGRIVAGVVAGLIGAMIVAQLITNPAFDWAFTFEAMNQRQVIRGFIAGTLLATVGAMAIGVALGVALAVMRMSANPVLRWTSAIYIWFFRAVPRYVLLMILGAAGAFAIGGLGIGIPYDREILALFGIDGTMRIATIDLNRFSTTVWMAIFGLGLSEAAYMAEIARSGIMSVDQGQWEAARALGMSNSETMRRIILPQAMRVIIPPTGNETIAMFKDTSLLSALPLANEMFFQIKMIGTATYKLIPSYTGATLYYVLTATLLGFGQSWLEKRFGRGYSSSGSQGGARRTKVAVDPNVSALRFAGADH